MQTTVGNPIKWHFVNMGVLRDLFIAVKVCFDFGEKKFKLEDETWQCNVEVVSAALGRV